MEDVGVDPGLGEGVDVGLEEGPGLLLPGEGEDPGLEEGPPEAVEEQSKQTL